MPSHRVLQYRGLLNLCGPLAGRLSMLAEQRHQYILAQVTKNGALSVAELVRELNVSRETIRRDLNTLAARGLVVTTHGGALSGDRREPDLDVREAANASAKRAIGERAADLVPDGASLIIDSGSTTQAVARALTGRHRLTVYTNDWRIALLLACSIPFFTSNVIRMISWIPFLGREGILNTAVLATHLVSKPLDFLLFSDFAVVVAYVHIFTLMMVAPIVNSMAKIDKDLVTAARDAGASEFQIARDIVIPLSKTGIALGSVLVLTQVMGDYYIVHVLGGGKSAGVVSGISTQLVAFEYPPAAASSVVLLVVVIALVGCIFSLVDVRKELAG